MEECEKVFNSYKVYADYVAWSQAEVAIDRIYRDDQFFEDCLEKARNFFVYRILPEIVGKWYTRIPVAESDGTVPTPALTSQIIVIMMLMMMTTMADAGVTVASQVLGT